MKIKLFIDLSVVISLIFFSLSYYIYKSVANVELPLESALTLTFSFIGSVGTIASIIFAIWINNSNKKSQQPKFILDCSKPIENVENSTGNKSLTIEVHIVNYGHPVTGFFIVPTHEHSRDIVISVKNDHKILFNRTDEISSKFIIKYSSYKFLTPNISDLKINFSLSYLDLFNTPHFDYYEITYINDRLIVKSK